MPRIEETRKRKKNRKKLNEVIPLETPIHMFVDPSAACNFKCKFCFNTLKGRKPNSKIMEMELFKKIVDDLTCFPEKLNVLRLYKEGEPLINKNLPEMIRYAKEKNVCEQIDFTTNGSLLTPNKNIELINSGLDAINISVEGINEKDYWEVSGVKIDFEEFVRNIRHLYKNKQNCRIHIKATDRTINQENKNLFENIFGEYCDELSIEHVVPIWPDMDFDSEETISKNIYNEEMEKLEICPYIFYSFTINSDGSVSSCFVDWEHRNILGNVKVDSVYDIWHGKKLYDLRLKHLQNCIEERCICKNCGQLLYGSGDNIDKFKEELQIKLNQKYRNFV